ncbi:hypothetical protein ACFLSX_00155 [Calditrichota bacterium]
MDSIFIIQIIISFVVAGAWIAFATLAAERLGSKIGGLITNLPSNILISMIFIAIVHDTSFVVATVPSIPLGMAIDTLFLFAFIIFLRWGLVISTSLSLFIWFLLAIIAANLNFSNLVANLFVYIIITIICFILLEKFYLFPGVKKSNKKYSINQILVRAIFAGGVVASIVLISKFFNPYIVGIFSAFPAVLLTSMIILTMNQNKEFAQATGKVLILSSSNIVVYSLAVYNTFPKFGMIIGTIISFIVAFVWIWLFLPIVRKIA